MACALSEIVFVIQLLESLATAKYAKQLAIKVSKAHWTQLLLTRGLSTSLPVKSLYYTNLPGCCQRQFIPTAVSQLSTIFPQTSWCFLSLRLHFLNIVKLSLTDETLCCEIQHDKTLLQISSVGSTGAASGMTGEEKHNRQIWARNRHLGIIEILLAEKCVTANQSAWS